MNFETDERKRTIQRWTRLAIQLNGAADSGNYDEITPAVVLRELHAGRIFDFLVRELPADVWTISKLTDVDHELSQQWRRMADACEPKQFHVQRNGLALLVAYLLHFIDMSHAIIPK
jgi:hypothetical protein